MSNYTAPVAGYYRLTSATFKYTPTGTYHRVMNEDRLWFQFWKPKLVVKEIFDCSTVMDGQEVKYLNAGDTVPFPIINRL